MSLSLPGWEWHFCRLPSGRKAKIRVNYLKAEPDFTPIAFKVLAIGQKPVKVPES
jgi:hypothetical protein